MSTKKANAGQSKLKFIHVEGVCSYPSLFTLKKNNLNPDRPGRFETMVILEPGSPAIEQLKALIRAAGEEAWGADQSAWPKIRGEDGAVLLPRIPLKRCDDKADLTTGKLPEGMQKGGYFFTAVSQRPVGIVGPDLHPITDPTQIYGGCRILVSVNAWTYGGPSMRYGINIGMRNVKKVADGTPFGGARIAPEAEFAPPSGGTTPPVGGKSSASDLI